MDAIAKLIGLLQNHPETKVIVGVRQDVIYEDFTYSIGQITNAEYRKYVEVELDDDRGGYTFMFEDDVDQETAGGLDWLEGIFVTVDPEADH